PGPVDAEGGPAASAVDDVDDVAAWARYMRRVLDAVERTVDRAGGPVALACEVTVPPSGRRIALADWLVPRQILAGLLAYDPGTVLIRTAAHGRRRPVESHYPPELWPARGGRGGRPASWGPNEARRGERDHERAAWDIAGAGAAVLARRAASGAVCCAPGPRWGPRPPGRPSCAMLVTRSGTGRGGGGRSPWRRPLRSGSRGACPRLGRRRPCCCLRRSA